MAWPVSQDYNEAVQDPRASFDDPELKAGEAITNALGLPMPRSGNFADVYEIHCPATQNKWAVKCFTRHVRGLDERYREISSALAEARLPFTVEFQYLSQGIRVRGEWFPILKMRWVEGLLLNEFVRDNLDKPAVLGQLGIIWARMGKRLREANIAHADLQHGNVLLVSNKKNNSLAVRLIDYDGMFVPTLASTKSGEVGHPNYQHPQRLKLGTYSAAVDRFPLLVVATALRALSIGGRELWDRHDNGDNLLFREADLAAPAKSALFQELKALTDGQTRALVAELEKALERNLDEAPALDTLDLDANSTNFRPGTPALEKSREPVAVVEEPPVAITKPTPLSVEQKTPETYDEIEETPVAVTKPKPTAKESRRGVPTGLFLGCGAAAFVSVFVVFAAGLGYLFLSGKKGDPIVQVKPPAIVPVKPPENKGKVDPIVPVKPPTDPDKDGKNKPVVDPPLKIELVVPVKPPTDPDKDGKNKPVVDPPKKIKPFIPAKPPTGSVVVQLPIPGEFALKQKATPKMIAQFTRNLKFCLSTDGERLGYSVPDMTDTFAYRQAPNWNLEQKVKLAVDNESPEPITSFPDGKKMVLVSGNNDMGRIVVWNWLTGQVDRQILTQAKPRDVIVSPDMRFLAANILTRVDEIGSDDVFLYDLESGKEIKNWRIKNFKIRKGLADPRLLAFGFTPDSKNLIISEKQNESSLVYSVKDGSAAALPFSRSGFPQAFSSDFTRVTNRHTVPRELHVINVAANATLCTLKSPDAKTHFTTTAFSPGGRYLLVRMDIYDGGTRRAYAMLVDVQSGEALAVTDEFPNSSNAINMELAANGVAFLDGGGFTPRLYRFANVQSDAFVKSPKTAD